MWADVVHRQKPSVVGQEPADLPEDSVNHRNVVRGCIVDHEVELFGGELRRVDVHLVVFQWHVMRARLAPRFVEQRFGIVDADGLTDDARLDHLPLDPSVPAVENQRTVGRFAATHEEVVKPLARRSPGDALVEHPLNGFEVVPIAAVVVDAFIVVDVELRHVRSPTLCRPTAPASGPSHTGWQAESRRQDTRRSLAHCLLGRQGPGGRTAPPGPRSVRVGHAEVVVLGDDDLTGVGPTGRAGGIPAHLEGPERLLQRVVGEQPPDEGVTQVEEHLDGLDGLDRPDDAGQHSRARRPRSRTGRARPAAARG